MVRDELREWLENKPVTLWGRAYDLKNPESVDLAVEWFYEQINSYMNWVDEHDER